MKRVKRDNKHIKTYKKLGKSIPKTTKASKSRDKSGPKLNISKIPSKELYNEAMENITKIRDSLLKDQNLNLEHKREDMNESFGHTNRTYKESHVHNMSNYIDNCINNRLSPAKYDYERDDRLELVLKVMDLENLFEIFHKNNLNFNDLLFLNKEDLVELDMSLASRNRILKFSEAYRSFGKEFSINEIFTFFNKNKSFIIKSLPYNKNYIEEEKVNVYENMVQSTANFAEEKINPKRPLNDVFIKKNRNNIKNQNNDIPHIVHTLGNDEKTYDNYYNMNDEMTLSDYVQKFRTRNDSEEKASQTIPLKKDYPKGYEFDDHNIKLYKEEPNLSMKSTLHTGKRMSYEKDIPKNIIANNSCLENNAINKKGRVNSKERNNRNKKYVNIQKEYQSIASDIDNYLKTFKNLKEKSDDRNNRLKCLIQKSSKSRSNSKEINKEPSCIPHYDSLKKLGLNFDDLEVEDERNLNDEMSKLLNRINSASKLSLDSQGVQHLNRIKSLTNLKSEKRNLEIKDINYINKEVDKLYDLINKKKELHLNLSKCNQSIVDNKKLLKMLEEDSQLYNSPNAFNINSINCDNTIDEEINKKKRK